MYYSITLDNTNISTLGKGKVPVSVNSVESYIKEQLAIEIQRFSAVNVQLVNDKMETEKIKVNLEVDRVRLFNEKNFLVTKREEFQIEIVTLNVVELFNILVCSY